MGEDQSDWDLSNISRSELEDDEVTVSSKDTGSAPGQRARPFSPSATAAVSNVSLINPPLRSADSYTGSPKSMVSRLPFRNPLLNTLNLKEVLDRGQILTKAPSNLCLSPDRSSV